MNNMTIPIVSAGLQKASNLGGSQPKPPENKYGQNKEGIICGPPIPIEWVIWETSKKTIQMGVIEGIGFTKYYCLLVVVIN